MMGPESDQEGTMQDLFAIDGKTAIVTGGTRGIGLMIARGLVEAGAKVYVSSRKADACEEVSEELSEVGDCVGFPADLSSEEGCLELVRAFGEREEALHVLVNNAGANWGEPFEEFPDHAWDRCLDLNLRAPFHLTKGLHGHLLTASAEGDPARVINIGSIDGIQAPDLETYAYSASKAAVHHMTRVLAKRLAPEITVNAVAPGPFESKMMAATLDALGDAIRESCPMKRIGHPDDMAGIAVFLSSRASTYITGAVIPVDGGIATTR